VKRIGDLTPKIGFCRDVGTIVRTREIERPGGSRGDRVSQTIRGGKPQELQFCCGRRERERGKQKKGREEKITNLREKWGALASGLGKNLCGK